MFRTAMTLTIKLKMSKAAIKSGLRSDAYIDTRPRYAKEQDPKCRVERKVIHDLLDDYEALVKAVKRAGYSVVRPSGSRNLGPITDKDVPAFLKKEQAPKKKRTRL